MLVGFEDGDGRLNLIENFILGIEMALKIAGGVIAVGDVAGETDDAVGRLRPAAIDQRRFDQFISPSIAGNYKTASFDPQAVFRRRRPRQSLGFGG